MSGETNDTLVDLPKETQSEQHSIGGELHPYARIMQGMSQDVQDLFHNYSVRHDAITGRRRKLRGAF